MKKTATLFTAFIFGIVTLHAQPKSSLSQNQVRFTLPANMSPSEFIPKTLVLKVKASYRNSCSRYGFDHAGFNQLFAAVGGSDFEKVFPFTPAPAEEYNKYGQKMTDLSLTYNFRYSADINLVKIVNMFLNLGVFEYVEPKPLPKITLNSNDPFATPGYQYHLSLIKASGAGTSAWNITRGDSAVVIGITDTGTDPAHPDLDPNIKRNMADPVNGIDDDGDGYIDNYKGWDLPNNTNNPTWQGDAHGVHVCGIAAAATNNSTGVAGVGYLCKFLPVKIADATGALTKSYEGITYAADHGVKVINCSWGGAFGGSFGQSVIDYATVNKDVLVVAACGNNNMDQDFYPSSFDKVVSVAATDYADARAGFSNYNYRVAVSAPGNNIYSTYSGSTYTFLSGTSMASPVTAGACALIRVQYPAYNAMQTAARLKQTTFNHYGVGGNSAYMNKLGTGRVDLYNALSAPAAPWVQTVVRNITDNNDQAYNPGDTLRITGNYTNYLAPTTNLTATLSCSSPFVSIQLATVNLGVVATMGTVNNNTLPFKAKLIGNPPINQQIDFQITFNDGTYTSSEFFSVLINVDYININVNDVATTVTSKSLVGYNDNPTQTQGLGFQYLTYGNLMYEGGLMVGVSSTQVSNNVRAAGSTPSTAFISTQRVQQIIPSVVSNFDASGIFSDAGASSPLPIRIRQKDYAWTSAGNRKYVILEYFIKNTGSTALSNLYAGIFADYDITATTAQSNKDAFDAANKMGYAWYTGTNGLYAGTKLLTSSAPVKHYGIDNAAGGGGGIDPTTASGFTDAMKYTVLSTNRANAGGVGTGGDVMDVTSTGPYTIAAGDSIKVAFALIAGDNLVDLQTSAVNAQNMYNTLVTGIQEVKQEVVSLNNYPNPATGSATLHVTLMEDLKADLSIYDLNGRKVATLHSGELKAGEHQFTVNLTGYAAGVYVYKLVSENGTQTCRLVVTK